MSVTSESSVGESSRGSEPLKIACAIRVELIIKLCDLPPHIVSICLERESRRVRVLATFGARATFYILAPAPSPDAAAPLPITFRLCNRKGQDVHSQSLLLSQLLSPDGWSLPKRDITSSEVLQSGAAKDDQAALRILASATLLSDPVKELPVVSSKVLVLADHKIAPASVSPSEQLHFNDCVRLRYAVPCVPIQCNTPNVTAIPFVTHIQFPRKLSFWALRRPLEPDDDEDQLIDIGDGVYAPKRNIAKLRRAVMKGQGGSKLPAQSGRMSLLQACSLKPVDAFPPLTIPLGKPISLERSTVVEASKILDQEYQYIDDVYISDSESDDLEDEGEEDEESGDEGTCEPEVDKPQYHGVESSAAHVVMDVSPSAAAPNEESGDPTYLRRNPSMVDAVVATEKASPDTPALHKPPSREPLARELSSGQEPFARRPSSDFGSGARADHENLDPEIAYSPLMRRVDKAERERSILQHQLSRAHVERERLLEQVRSASLISKCASIEAELISLRKAHVDLQADHAAAIAGRAAPAKSEELRAKMEEMEALVRVGERYKSQLREMQHENERLLGVIGQLSKELERQPGAPQILSELAAVKTDLAVEQLENERLVRELKQMKGDNSPTSVLPGSTKRWTDF